MNQTLIGSCRQHGSEPPPTNLFWALDLTIGFIRKGSHLERFLWRSVFFFLKTRVHKIPTAVISFRNMNTNNLLDVYRRQAHCYCYCCYQNLLLAFNCSVIDSSQLNFVEKKILKISYLPDQTPHLEVTLEFGLYQSIRVLPRIENLLPSTLRNELVVRHCFVESI